MTKMCLILHLHNRSKAPLAEVPVNCLEKGNVYGLVATQYQCPAEGCKKIPIQMWLAQHRGYPCTQMMLSDG